VGLAPTAATSTDHHEKSVGVRTGIDGPFLATRRTELSLLEFQALFLMGLEPQWQCWVRRWIMDCTRMEEGSRQRHHPFDDWAHITPSKRTSPEEATNSSTSSTLPKSIQTILQREWNFNQGKIGTSFFQLFVLSLPNENAPLGSVNIIIFSIRDNSWSAMPWTDLLSMSQTIKQFGGIIGLCSIGNMKK
jgi:hypothetical protein